MGSDPACEIRPDELDFPGLLDALASRLHPLETPPSRLPVRGYDPGSGKWQPRPAAVLVPIVTGPEPGIILTVRSERLAHHAGQVAFPGGGRSHAGESPIQTALREAREEVGLRPAQVRTVGLLDRFDTISAFRVVPVVALVRPPVEYRPNPAEVSQVFTLPLATVLDAGSYLEHRVEFQGRFHTVASLKETRPLVWGATAAILRHLCVAAGEGVGTDEIANQF